MTAPPASAAIASSRRSGSSRANASCKAEKPRSAAAGISSSSSRNFAARCRCCATTTSWPVSGAWASSRTTSARRSTGDWAHRKATTEAWSSQERCSGSGPSAACMKKAGCGWSERWRPLVRHAGPLRARALIGLAHMHHFQGRPYEDLVSEALVCGQHDGDPWTISFALFMQGMAAVRARRPRAGSCAR